MCSSIADKAKFSLSCQLQVEEANVVETADGPFTLVLHSLRFLAALHILLSS